MIEATDDGKVNKDPVLYQYKGRNIRRYNKLFVHVSPLEYRKIIDCRIDNGLSATKAVTQKGILCSTSREYIKSNLSGSNPIIQIYRDIPVRRYNVIKLNVTEYQFKLFIDINIDFKLSVRQAIQEKNFLCPCSLPMFSKTLTNGKYSNAL